MMVAAVEARPGPPDGTLAMSSSRPAESGLPGASARDRVPTGIRTAGLQLRCTMYIIALH